MPLSSLSQPLRLGLFDFVDAGTEFSPFVSRHVRRRTGDVELDLLGGQGSFSFTFTLEGVFRAGDGELLFVKAE